MSTKIFFDLDGTLFDLYGKSEWLERLQNEDPTVFEGDGMTKGFLSSIDLVNLFEVANMLAEKGVQFEVITWLPMGASPEYEFACDLIKRKWVKENLPFITKVTCLSYGIPKQNGIEKRAAQMFLVDDNEEICKMWETAKMRKAILVDNDFTVVDALYSILDGLSEGA